MDPIAACNQALIELGSRLITSFDDGTSVSTVCGQVYPDTRDEVLQLAPWNFATTFAVLALSADTPAMTWAYQFPLPTNPYCLQVRQTDRDAWVQWEIGLDAAGHRVLFSDEAAVSIEYTARVVDLNLWSPLAGQVLVKMLAARLAKVVTGQNSTEELKLKEALALLPEAKTKDAQEGAPRLLRRSGRLVHARLGGSAWWSQGYPRW